MARRKKKGTGEDDDWIDAPNQWTSDSEKKAPSTGMRIGRAAVVDPPPKPSYIGPLAAMLICCPVFGLVAVFYAVQVPARWRRGDQMGSRYAAERSEFWMYAAVGAGVLIHIVWWIYYYFSFRHRGEFGY